jgi:colicin import membrane protein
MINNALCRETWRKETERKRTELGLDNVVAKQETVTQEVVGEIPKKPEDTNRMVGEKPKKPEDSTNNSRASDKEKKTEHGKQTEKQAKIAKKKDDREVERGKRDKQQTEREDKAAEKTADKEPERDKQSAGGSKAAKANNERVMQEIAAIESRLGKRRLKEIAEGRGKKKRSEKRAEEAAAGGDVNRRSKNDGGDMEEGEYPDSDEEPATRPSGPSPVKRKEGGGGGGGVEEVEDSETKKQREREEKKQRWKRRGLAEDTNAGRNDTGKCVLHDTSSFSS